MCKKILSILSIIFFLASCGGGSFDQVKRGITGQKQKSTDEFLVQKKDPLILPPDYENLPLPDQNSLAEEEISSFKKSLEKTIEDDTTSSSSTEGSILKKIQSQ
jgi:hypothetical protein